MESVVKFVVGPELGLGSQFVTGFVTLVRSVVKVVRVPEHGSGTHLASAFTLLLSVDALVFIFAKNVSTFEKCEIKIVSICVEELTFLCC